MNILFDIINIIPLSVLAVIAADSLTDMTLGNIPGHSVNIFTCIMLIIFRHMNRKNKLRLTGITAAFCIGIAISADETDKQLFLSEYGHLGIIILISAAAFGAGMLIGNNLWARRFAALTLWAVCIAGMILRWEIGKAAFALILFLLCIYTAAEIQGRWKKEGCSDLNPHIARLSPVLLILCITVYFIPAYDKPYDWQFIKDFYNTASLYASRLISLVTHPTEEYAGIGFSDSSGFYDELKGGDRDVLNISCGTGRLDKLRLTGCISGEFDGTKWIFDTRSEGCVRMTDTLETLCAVRKYDEEHHFDYVKKTDIYYENLLPNTKFIFTPSKARTVIAAADNPPFTEHIGSITAKRRMTYGDSYTFSHYTLNPDNEQLIMLLDNAQPITEEDWLNTLREEALININGCAYSDYLEYQTEIYEKYGSPEGVSEEVKKLLDNITADSEGRYEMMKALEGYLGNMEYSLSDGALPQTVQDSGSYLDHFLLSSKKGSCIHYATAFVLLARELGVPCRYVQGYYINTEPFTKFTVKESQAHAWPEVYFDNFGWVPFEPTPGYSSGSGWLTSAERSAYYSDYYEEYPEDEYSEDTENENAREKKQKDIEIAPQMIIIPVLSAVGALTVIFICSRAFSRLRYRKMENEEKFRYLTRENMRLLGYMGYPTEDCETLTEYRSRLLCLPDSTLLTEHLDFISYYERLIYSDLTISDKQIDNAEQTYVFLRSIIFKGKLRYRIMLLLR